tara:strand:- start:160 stop:603 length:444 start_codon:yes stop_codon:yes gene_type:complete
MADAKLSELTAATTAAGTDSLYLVQSSSSKKITIANLFADVATPVKFSDTIAITDTNTQTSTGAISTTTNITFISDVDGGGACTLAAGVDGQIKIVIMISNSGGHTLSINSSSTIANTTTFTAAGHSATLLYTNSKWYFIGGTATVS